MESVVIDVNFDSVTSKSGNLYFEDKNTDMGTLCFVIKDNNLSAIQYFNNQGHQMHIIQMSQIVCEGDCVVFNFSFKDDVYVDVNIMRCRLDLFGMERELGLFRDLANDLTRKLEGVAIAALLELSEGKRKEDAAETLLKLRQGKRKVNFRF